MFEGYRFTTFMDALNRWDTLNKKAKCIYRQQLYNYDVVTEWREHFQPLHGGLILDGEWYTEI